MTVGILLAGMLALQVTQAGPTEAPAVCVVDSAAPTDAGRSSGGGPVGLP